MCLIARAADNLINFQAVVKNELSKFELLKCCRIFQQRPDKLRTLKGAAQISRKPSGHLLRLSSELHSIRAIVNLIKFLQTAVENRLSNLEQALQVRKKI